MTITSKLVKSSDGSIIHAEATGNPKGPALVFVPGYTLCTIVFEKQFDDPVMREQLYMVGQFEEYAGKC